ncbi:hypothetical protein Taro_038082 [Colocasia esculenta]|uniref:Uncharacterized protein n=1 Tax=Colocasia esculenta TaxID=4460 RepID=A0A843WI49_COLES|nr:hypothetical protein [Colocasia esculenta]
MAASGSSAPKINSSSTEETNAHTNTSGTITITTSTTATISTTNANSNRNEAPDFPGVVNLISFFSTERRLFIRLSKPLNQDAEKCKVIMALWLWLDAIGHRGFIRQAHASSDSVLTQFVREATLCMECLLGQQVLTRLDTIEIPLTAWLLEEPINLRFFVYHRDVIMRGILYILDNVCRVVFDDKVLLSVAEDSLNSYHQLVMASGFVKYHPSGRGRRDAAAPEASEGKGKGKEIDVASQPPSPATAQGKAPVLSVNADHEPVLGPSFRASPASQPMEQRAAFISFTSGQHVPQDEIAQFFNA